MLWRPAHAACSAIALLLSATLTHAYVMATDSGGRPVRWTARTIQLVVAPAPGELKAALHEATERAAARWSTATGLTIRVRADPHAPLQVSEDGRSTVLLRTRRWCPDDPAQPCYDPSRHALTQLYTRPRAGDPKNAEILEADIEVNAVDFDWRALPPRSLDAVLLHELGHLLGLDHSCGATTLLERTDQQGSPVPICRSAPGVALESVMYPDPLNPGHGGRVELTDDELLAAADLYGAPSRGRRLTFSAVLAVLGLGTVGTLWLVRNRPPSG